MSDIAKNVIPFPSPSIQNIIAEWESKAPLLSPNNRDEGISFLRKMVDDLARRSDTLPESRDAIIESIDRLRKPRRGAESPSRTKSNQPRASICSG
jgi:hypothetical protein